MHSCSQALRITEQANTDRDSMPLDHKSLVQASKCQCTLSEDKRRPLIPHTPQAALIGRQYDHFKASQHSYLVYSLRRAQPVASHDQRTLSVPGTVCVYVWSITDASPMLREAQSQRREIRRCLRHCHGSLGVCFGSVGREKL